MVKKDLTYDEIMRNEKGAQEGHCLPPASLETQQCLDIDEMLVPGEKGILEFINESDCLLFDLLCIRKRNHESKCVTM